ncbi:MAG TPA: 4-hydroxytetrahydrobiopterin dehydratase, partial [Alcanivorax sp.]|nr:4-hydroxytetrahydrobiopterin dehydratase [Alcanivorax sp.]
AETRAFIREKWHEPFGDMRQELVFIGQGMDPAHTRRALDACLLSEDETRAGLEYWRTLPDPFPDWGLEEAS